jgi:predicted nucleotidyltransferase/DNA-binding HxlR family transcriptional regulator
MNTLAELLSSKGRAEIFRLLFDGRNAEAHIRELARLAGISESALRQELGRLAKLELLRHRRSSNRVYYRANEEHPLYPEIRNLVAKTVGLAGVLRTALTDPAVRAAFVFGSAARGELGAASDVDLMVIGDLGLRRVADLLAPVHGAVGRDVNPHVFTLAEYRRRLAENDHFLRSVLSGPKLFVVGDETELAAMG